MSFTTPSELPGSSSIFLKTLIYLISNSVTLERIHLMISFKNEPMLLISRITTTKVSSQTFSDGPHTISSINPQISILSSCIPGANVLVPQNPAQRQLNQLQQWAIINNKKLSVTSATPRPLVVTATASFMISLWSRDKALAVLALCTCVRVHTLSHKEMDPPCARCSCDSGSTFHCSERSRSSNSRQADTHQEYSHPTPRTRTSS